MTTTTTTTKMPLINNFLIEGGNMPPIAECECGAISPDLSKDELHGWRAKHVKECKFHSPIFSIKDQDGNTIGGACTSQISDRTQIDDEYYPDDTGNLTQVRRVNGQIV